MIKQNSALTQKQIEFHNSQVEARNNEAKWCGELERKRETAEILKLTSAQSVNSSFSGFVETTQKTNISNESKNLENNTSNNLKL